jgi:hypothetical protein
VRCTRLAESNESGEGLSREKKNEWKKEERERERANKNSVPSIYRSWEANEEIRSTTWREEVPIRAQEIGLSAVRPYHLDLQALVRRRDLRRLEPPPLRVFRWIAEHMKYAENRRRRSKRHAYISSRFSLELCAVRSFMVLKNHTCTGNGAR